MFTPLNASASTQAVGFIFGDGTVTAVDAVASPPRLWGATQNLGNFLDDDGPKSSTKGGDVGAMNDDTTDDDIHYGFGFWQEGTGFVGVPLTAALPGSKPWFSTLQFPFFVQPFALLSNDPSTVYLYAASGTGSSASLQTGGIYKLVVPSNVTKPEEIAPPTLELATENVYILIAGGNTSGAVDSCVLVAINDTHLMHRSATSGGVLVPRKLPTRFARPIVFDYVKNAKDEYEYVLGPTSHDRTVSLAVSPADSALLAVSGWTSLLDNNAVERIWLSRDAGRTYLDVTGNLRTASQAIGMMRPSALLLLPIKAKGPTALIVGVATGVYVTTIMKSAPATAATQTWTRLGSCDQLPLVLVAGLSYEPADDTLVAATMGRGVYVVNGVTKAMEAIVEQDVV